MQLLDMGENFQLHCVIFLSNRNWSLDGIMPYKQMAIHFNRVKLPPPSPCGVEWRKLHNEELNDLYCSTQYCASDKIKKNEMGETCGTYEGGERRVQGFGGET